MIRSTAFIPYKIKKFLSDDRFQFIKLSNGTSRHIDHGDMEDFTTHHYKLRMHCDLHTSWTASKNVLNSIQI